MLGVRSLKVSDFVFIRVPARDGWMRPVSGGAGGQDGRWYPTTNL